MPFGDPDVGSGAFRGAAPEHFARLATVLGETRVLTGSHRGTPAQADLVRRLTQRTGAIAYRSAQRPGLAALTRIGTSRAAKEAFGSSAATTVVFVVRDDGVTRPTGTPSWHMPFAQHVGAMEVVLLRGGSRDDRPHRGVVRDPAVGGVRWATIPAAPMRWVNRRTRSAWAGVPR